MTDLPPTEALLGLFARQGYRRVEPAILQPAEIFLDLSGEDIRRRMYVTQDASGQELCLRPEYTIPVCREHLAAASPSRPASYAYAGPVFRLRAGEPGEFLQAGIESIGRRDAPSADAEILGLAIEGLGEIGGDDPGCRVKLGDMGLLHAVVEALGVPTAARRRLLRAVASGRGLDAYVKERAQGDGAQDDAHAGLLAAIEGQAPQAARAFVEDVLSIAGITRVGGRSAAEIAERFLARAAASRSGILSGEGRDLLQRYLGVSSAPMPAAAAVRALARDAGLDLDEALAAFEERTARMAARGLDVDRFTFAADFARNLDYYTGFIFEIADPRRASGRPLVGGGRYDSLLRHLGAAGDVPAVGCAFWLDRIGTSPEGAPHG